MNPKKSHVWTHDKNPFLDREPIFAIKRQPRWDSAVLWNEPHQSLAPTDAEIQLRCNGTCSRIQGEKMDSTPEHPESIIPKRAGTKSLEAIQVLQPWDPK